jgi:hypothetical protein
LIKFLEDRAMTKKQVSWVCLIAGMVFALCVTGCKNPAGGDDGGGQTSLSGTTYSGGDGSTLEFKADSVVVYDGTINATYTITDDIVSIKFPLLGVWTYELNGNTLTVKSGVGANIGYVLTKT